MKVKMSDIRKHNPCKKSWIVLKKATSSEEVELTFILDLLGINDAVWSLRALEEKEREIRLFAADCAESVLDAFEKEYPQDKRPRKAIKAARDFAEGKISEIKLNAAARAAEVAAADAAGAARAARAAAWDAARAARPAGYAGYAGYAANAGDVNAANAAADVARAAEVAAAVAARAARAARDTAKAADAADAAAWAADAARAARDAPEETAKQEDLFNKYFC